VRKRNPSPPPPSPHPSIFPSCGGPLGIPLLSKNSKLLAELIVKTERGRKYYHSRPSFSPSRSLMRAHARASFQVKFQRRAKGTGSKNTARLCLFALAPLFSGIVRARVTLFTSGILKQKSPKNVDPYNLHWKHGLQNGRNV